jgi:Cu/Ag efflux pump CusA
LDTRNQIHILNIEETVKQIDTAAEFLADLARKGKRILFVGCKRQAQEAIREAGEVRFLPIILTTLTAIGGLIPIAISTNPLISPLAIVMIGGLISSTLLSRIITPVVYKLIPPRV